MNFKKQRMEQFKKMDRNQLLLSPSGGKQQTRVGFGAVTSTDYDDGNSEYHLKTVNKKSHEQSARQTHNESILSGSQQPSQ